jgi:hypothetical protein
MSIGADMMKGLEQQCAKLSIQRDELERDWLRAEIQKRRALAMLTEIETYFAGVFDEHTQTDLWARTSDILNDLGRPTETTAEEGSKDG